MTCPFLKFWGRFFQELFFGDSQVLESNSEYRKVSFVILVLQKV